jgi:hypothetical protein
MVMVTLAGCGAAGPGSARSGAAVLRGFGVEVEQVVAPRVPLVHLRTCGAWGCHEQDVPLMIAGPTSAMPCPSEAGAAPGAACGVAHLRGPGPGYGYAPVPALTMDPVTVTVTTPADAPFPIKTEVLVRPSAVCPYDAGRPKDTAPSPRTACPGATPQAGLRIAADGSVSQFR